MNTKNLAQRGGFTLVELLVVIAIIGAMMSLLLPAIMQVQERARQSNCASNLYNVGKGFTMHHDTLGALPVGLKVFGYKKLNVANHTAWVYLLPYIEQQTLFDRYHVEFRNDAPENQEVVTTVIPIYQCPSDNATDRILRQDDRRSFSRSNYVVCFGTKTMMVSDENPDNDGPFRVDKARKFRDLYKGISQTALASEVKTGQDDDWQAGKEADFRGVWAYHEAGAAAYTHKLLPNERPRTSADVDVGDAMFYRSSNKHCVNSEKMPCVTTAGPDWGKMYVAARSHHSGGVNLLIADQRVVFIDDQVDPEIWREWGSINEPKEQP